MRYKERDWKVKTKHTIVFAMVLVMLGATFLVPTVTTPPAADSGMLSNPIKDETIQFTDESYDTSSSIISTWYWEFGDGATSYVENPYHQYDDDGYYYAKLRVCSDGKYDTITKRIYVRNVEPEAESNVSLCVAAVGDNVTFNSSCYDVDGDIVEWEWQFGDGRRGCGNNTTHAYDFSGLFTIDLGITDDDCGTDNTVKDDYLLIADTMVRNSFNESSHGWNTTRFNDIQNAIYSTPFGGLLVILLRVQILYLLEWYLLLI